MKARARSFDIKLQCTHRSKLEHRPQQTFSKCPAKQAYQLGRKRAVLLDVLVRHDLQLQRLELLNLVAAAIRIRPGSRRARRAEAHLHRSKV